MNILQKEEFRYIYAGLAMNGILANMEYNQDTVVKKSVEMADALIAELEKEKQFFVITDNSTKLTDFEYLVASHIIACQDGFNDNDLRLIAKSIRDHAMMEFEQSLPTWRRFYNSYQAIPARVEGDNLEAGGRWIPLDELYKLPKED